MRLKSNNCDWGPAPEYHESLITSICPSQITAVRDRSILLPHQFLQVIG